MTISTLDPEFSPAPDRRLGKGHGTSSLGPSDTSDSGSDIHGGPGLAHDINIGLDRGTNEDPDEGGMDAGPDVGDANLDSDSDSAGSGERATAGRDSSKGDSRDIGTDRIDRIMSPEEWDQEDQ
jgi:hypothetical protein